MLLLLKVQLCRMQEKCDRKRKANDAHYTAMTNNNIQNNIFCPEAALQMVFSKYAANLQEKRNFNKVASNVIEIALRHGVFSYKFAAYFQNIFS